MVDFGGGGVVSVQNPISLQTAPLSKSDRMSQAVLPQVDPLVWQKGDKVGWVEIHV